MTNIKEKWNFTPPPMEDLGDHDVPLAGNHLKGKRIALLITGGIAALKTPLLARALRRQGADTVAFISNEGRRYVTEDTLQWSTNNPVVTKLTPAAEHLSDDRPFDAFLLAPATYNTINKMRYGIADGVVTSTLASAIGRMEGGTTQILLAPTMHGSLHNSILTESLKKLDSMGIRIIAPREAYGKHNIPSETTLVAEVCRAVSTSPLKGSTVMVTGGVTPVPIDGVRRITNKFTGALGIEIAKELYLRGAHSLLIHGGNGTTPPDYLPMIRVSSFDAYVDTIMNSLSTENYDAAIFSAAVADYKPDTVLPGKTPSGGALQTIKLVPTVKVIDKVHEKFKNLNMITFKYQENVTHEQLLNIAQQRLERGYLAVVANRGEERGTEGQQIAYIVSQEIERPLKCVGKPEIAQKLADFLEKKLDESNKVC